MVFELIDVENDKLVYQCVDCGEITYSHRGLKPMFCVICKNDEKPNKKT